MDTQAKQSEPPKPPKVGSGLLEPDDSWSETVIKIGNQIKQLSLEELQQLAEYIKGIVK